jgi:N-acyl-L-homoserine lactone synthetase
VALCGPYRVSFAIAADSRAKEFRLRYQYFVEECRFEPADRFPDGLEHDEFDDVSCALLVEDADTEEAAACQRLVLPDQLPPGLPTNIERHYSPLPGGEGVEFSTLPRHLWAEASRTTVAKKYRWGSARTEMPGMVPIKYGSLALAIAFGRSTLFSLSEPRTGRLIRKLGFPMVQIGAPIEFHGTRAPFAMRVVEMEDSVPASDRPIVDALILEALQLAAQARTQFGVRVSPTTHAETN